MADITAPRNTFFKLLRSPDLLVALGIITILIMFIFPLPAFFLDVFLSLSIAASLLILLLVLFSQNPLELSIFPTMLLLLTLFRLGLNISSTRLILSQGPAFNVHLIKAFGTFVVMGNFIVGVIIFIVIIVVQYIVISRGTTRMSEVAARFALDSLPGKQMMIDSDLAAGIINEQEAIQRRQNLQRETDFYGAMDGASKFVQGDVIVGIFVTVINVIGGILIGALKFNMGITDAMQTFIIFSIGDGLVSQIPSLLNGVSAGIIVSRSVANDSIGRELNTELIKQSLPLWVVAGTLGVLAFIPGFPWYSFLPLAGLFGFMAYRIGVKERSAKTVTAAAEKEAAEEKPVIIDKLVPIEPIALEIGYALIPLVDKKSGGDLFDRISNVRKQIAFDYGMIVPPIMVRDSLRLESDEYQIKIHGVRAVSWKVHPEKLLAINPGIITGEIEGIKVKEPTYNLDAVWIDPDKKDKAESFGYTVIDCGTVIATHLTETVISNVDSLLGREEVKKIIDSIKDDYKTLVDELNIKDNLGLIQKVFQNLLSEKISIRNISTILETIVNHLRDERNPDVITEFVRQKLKNQICMQYADDDGRLKVYTLNARLENYLAGEFEKVERSGVTTMNPQFLNSLIGEVAKAEEDGSNKKIEQFIILTSTRLRRYLRSMLRSIFPKAVYLSYDEISPQIRLEYSGEIAMPARQQKGEEGK